MTAGAHGRQAGPVRAIVAEFVGTTMLLVAVVGSGIMGEQLAGGNIAIALLANTLATGAALVALILTFGPISGAHLNPAVSFADASQGGLSWTEANVGTRWHNSPGHSLEWLSRTPCSPSRCTAWSRHARSGSSQVLAEAVATFGLLAVIRGCAQRRPSAVPFAVGSVHYGRVLVYLIDFVRQSGRDARAIRHGYVHRHSRT